MVTADLLQRSIDKIARLSGEPRDLAGYWRECTEVVGSVIPHYWTPCWYTLDPASLLATSHFHEGMVEFPAEWLANEYYGDDVNQMAHVARSRTGIPPCTRPPTATPRAVVAGVSTSPWAAIRR